MSTFHPVQSADAMGSAIWCMDSNSDKSMLAVGCDDGKVNELTWILLIL